MWATGYGMRGDFAAALELATRALAVGPDEPWAWFSSGITQFFAHGPSIAAANQIIRAAELLGPEHPALKATYHGMAAAAAGRVDSSLAAAQVARAEELLEAGLAPQGQLTAQAALARAALATGDFYRANELSEQTLADTSNPRSRIRLGAYGMRAEALASLPESDAAPAFLDALEQYGQLGWWGQIWRTLVPLARWWVTTGNITAAAMTVSCAKANRVNVAGLDELAADLSDPSLQVAHQQGARMSRTELLEYVMAELAPVATAGSLTT